MLGQFLSGFLNVSGWICIVLGGILIVSGFLPVLAGNTDPSGSRLFVAFGKTIFGMMWAGGGGVLMGISKLISTKVNQSENRGLSNSLKIVSLLFSLIGLPLLAIGVYGAVKEYSKPEGPFDIALTYVWSAILSGGFIVCIAIVALIISRKLRWIRE